MLDILKTKVLEDYSSLQLGNYVIVFFLAVGAKTCQQVLQITLTTYSKAHLKVLWFQHDDAGGRGGMVMGHPVKIGFFYFLPR